MNYRRDSIITEKTCQWLAVILLSAVTFAEKLPHFARGQAAVNWAENRSAYEPHTYAEIAEARLDEAKEKALRKALGVKRRQSRRLKQAKEKALRKALDELRQAIKEYHVVCEQGLVGPVDRKEDDKCYPPTLKTLVDGIQPPSVRYYIRFLRRLPTDPMTGTQDWGLRSAQDEKDAATWGGENVADVYSKSDGIAADGTRYRDW